MPSADELSKLYSKENHIAAFLEVTVKDIELSAKHGNRSDVIDVPAGLKREDIEGPLREAFPGCKIEWAWFIQSYRISW